jgi:hypothetical protein
MKTNKKYVFLSLATVVAVVGVTIGAFSLAQTTTPVTCSVAPSPVVVNQMATLTATGGDGSYTWSGQNLNVTNPMGTQFLVSYPNTGTYPVTVTSAGQSATCDVNVVAAGSVTATSTLACYPATQNVTLGQVADVSASGGNGSYTWSSPDITITNPNGSGFSANFATTGFKTLTVMSGGLTTTCMVDVLSGSATTPGLPNTGGGYGQ